MAGIWVTSFILLSLNFHLAKTHFAPPSGVLCSSVLMPFSNAKATAKQVASLRATATRCASVSEHLRYQRFFPSASEVRSRTPFSLRTKLSENSIRPALSLPAHKNQESSRPCLHFVHTLFRHRLFLMLARNIPPASSLLASSHISHTRIHFVHNLYTKTRTAANRAYNLHPH